MNDDTIQNQINEIVSTTPAATKEEAKKPIEDVPYHSTLRTGTADQIQTAPVSQYDTTADRGISFTPNTDEVMMDGTGIAGLGYDTRFKTSEDAGDPLYFEPNFLPVEPYPVGNIESNTLNKNKLGYEMAKTMGAWDKDYIGYYRLPESGSLSWWSHFVGSGMTFLESLPATLTKGAVGVGTSIAKIPALVPGTALSNATWRGLAQQIMDKAPESDAGSFLNTIFSNYEENIDALNNLQKVVNDAVSPLEQRAFAIWDANPKDNSFKAQSARAVMNGLGSFGLAGFTRLPELTFTLLNFAGVSDMRKKALDYGVSPKWAEAYSIGGAAFNSVLDMVQFEALINSTSLVKQGSVEYLENLGKKGLWNGFKKHALREVGVAGFEAGTEMIQTSVEEAYNPEFRKDPTDALAIAAISAFALKAITLPVSVRHANLEEQAVLAEKFGVKALYDKIRASGYVLADEYISKGALDPAKRDEFVQSLISEAPDMVVKTLREGAKGELDKISPENRQSMAEILKEVVENQGKEVFTPQTLAKIDTETDNALSKVRDGFSDSEVTMIKGLVRGAYVVSILANRNNPNFQFSVPTFVVANNKKGISYYSEDKNEIGIHANRSNTENTNNSPEYAKQIVKGFRRSTEVSDKMATVLHEMSHWLDHLVGKNGFGEFLEYYYNDISKVFGKEKAEELYNSANEGQNRISSKSKKGKSTEAHAQAIARLGRRAAESFGLGKSEMNQFLSYANVMLNQLANLEGKSGQKLTKAIDAYQTALQEVTKANMDHLSDLIEVYGSENIKDALQKFTSDEEGYADFAEYLANKGMLRELFDVMDGFADAAGIEKINDLFNNDQKRMDNFVTAGDRMFKSGYDGAVEEVRQRRQEAKDKADSNEKKTVEAKADKNAVVTDNGVVIAKTNDKINAEDMPTFFEAETGNQGEMQDWAKAALGAKESVKASFKSGKEEKQISADRKIDGRNLTDDIAMANAGLAKRLNAKMNPVVKWASSSKWGWGLDRILVTVLGRDAAEKFDLAGKYSAKQSIRTGYWDEFQKRLEGLFGSKDKTGFMYKYKTMVTDLGFVRMNNVEMFDAANPALSFKRNITGWEAMYVYLMNRQGYGDRVQKTTTTNINDIISLLSDNEKKFADTMSDQLMDMYQRTFKEGSKYEHYFPILSAEHEQYNELSIDSLTARQKTDDAIAIVDAGRIFSQYISRWASHESGYFETLKRLRDVFSYRGVSADETGPQYVFNIDEDEARILSSAQVAAAVRQVLGNEGYDNIMNTIESELRDKQELLFDKSRHNTLTQIGNNIMKSILANKAVSFPKNLANIMMMFGGAKDQSVYWNNFAEGWAKPKDTYKYMMEHSKEIKQRWSTAGGINEYLDQRTLGGNTAPALKAISKAFAKMEWNGDVTQNMAKFSAAMDMLGDAGLKVFMQSGDMFANVFGGYGLIKDYIAQGMTEEEAFKKLDRYIVEHQSSSNLAMKPLIQKEHTGDFLGQIFAFTSEGVAKWASIMGTFDEVKMGTATKQEAIVNMASIAMSMALYSLLAAGAWDLLDEDEKVREDTQKAVMNTVLDQVFGGIVAGNSLITPFVSYLVGDTRLSGMSTPFYNYAIDMGTDVKKGNYFDAWLKMQSAFGMPIGASNAWNTMVGKSLLNDPNPDVRYAGKLMMMGYTANRAAKRAGVKKETIENNNQE